MGSWTRERVFEDGDSYFYALKAAIASARSSVELQSYIFDRDALGNSILQLLAQAAQRGVKVRVLLDGVGSSSWSHADALALGKQGVEARFYHPLPWQRASGIFKNLSSISKLLRGIQRLNRRNHRKVCVIDGDAAFIGGINVSGRQVRSVSACRAWRDTAVEVEGPGVRTLQVAFDALWFKRAPGSRPRPRGDDSVVRINTTRADRLRLYRDLIERVLGSRRRIWVTTPYFAPGLSLLRALRYSAWCGIDVRLLVPRRSDYRFTSWIAGAFYGILHSAGIRVYEYAPTMIHAKTMLIDDWALVGSSNLNQRSLIHDLEADAVLEEPDSIRTLERQFDADLARSVEVQSHIWKRRSWLRRLAEQLVLRFYRYL